MTDLLAQRLWVLERDDGSSQRDGADVCCFVAAVAILADAAVYVVFVRSTERERADALLLRADSIRLQIERDASRFGTLDDAIEWTNARKQEWLLGGWSEALSDDGHG